MYAIIVRKTLAIAYHIPSKYRTLQGQDEQRHFDIMDQDSTRFPLCGSSLLFVMMQAR